MGAEILSIETRHDREVAVQRAARVLTDGGLVVFPTETVYGLAARADHAGAMRRLRAAKSREGGKAFTVHVGRVSDAARFVVRVPGVALRLIRKTWPGPVTLILDEHEPKQTAVIEECGVEAIGALYYDGSIGLRCPDHPVAEEVLRAIPHPVVAASANEAGQPPPTDATGVSDLVREAADLILDNGETRFARASTIVRVGAASFDVLREGVYDARTVKRLATLRVLFVCTGNTCRSPMAEALAKAMIAERVGCDIEELPDRGIVVSSAGTSGGMGRASEHAVAAMERRGLDIADRPSVALTRELIHQADHVLVMTRAHREAVLRMAPQSVDRTRLLLDEEDVRDPLGGSIDDYEQCAAAIETGLRERLEEVVL